MKIIIHISHFKGAIKIYRLPLPKDLEIWIDNTEVVRRRIALVPTLGIKQQLVLHYDLWATAQRIQKALPCTINWMWVKRHQKQGQGPNWKVEIEINNVCDQQADMARLLGQEGG